MPAEMPVSVPGCAPRSVGPDSTSRRRSSNWRNRLLGDGDLGEFRPVRPDFLDGLHNLFHPGAPSVEHE